MIGRKRETEKEKKGGEREERLVLKRLECEYYLTILITCLSNFKIHSLFLFLFFHKIEQI